MNYPTRLNVHISIGRDMAYLHMDGTLIAEPRAGGAIRITLDDDQLIRLHILEATEDIAIDRIRVEARVRMPQSPCGWSLQEIAGKIELGLVLRGWTVHSSPTRIHAATSDFADPVVQQQHAADKQ